ncbi:hypothetical protein [Inhella sp.]|uniref:hypothetical protein n=1 Tax=Inhella sp. TaxID=1921806 RepID=UPI0035B207DD
MNEVAIRTLVAMAVGLSLAGCDRPSNAGQFQVVSSPTGDLYRLQSSTGAMHKVVGATLVRVTETDRVQLQVGAVYVFENGSNMKYLGDGKFEPFKSDVLTLDEYLKAEGRKK